MEDHCELQSAFDLPKSLVVLLIWTGEFRCSLFIGTFGSMLVIQFSLSPVPEPNYIRESFEGIGGNLALQNNNILVCPNHHPGQGVSSQEFPLDHHPTFNHLPH